VHGTIGPLHFSPRDKHPLRRSSCKKAYTSVPVPVVRRRLQINSPFCFLKSQKHQSSQLPTPLGPIRSGSPQHQKHYQHCCFQKNPPRPKSKPPPKPASSSSAPSAAR